MTILVHTNSPHGVDGEPLVRINSNTEETRVGVDEPLNISLLQVEQNRSVIEIGQGRHVLAAVVLGRIDLSHQVLLVLLHVPLALPGHDLHLDLVPVGFLNNSLAKLLLGMRNVKGSFGVIDLFSNFLLRISRDEEVGGWIWVISCFDVNRCSRHDLDLRLSSSALEKGL